MDETLSFQCAFHRGRVFSCVWWLRSIREAVRLKNLVKGFGVLLSVWIPQMSWILYPNEGAFQVRSGEHFVMVQHFPLCVMLPLPNTGTPSPRLELATRLHILYTGEKRALKRAQKQLKSRAGAWTSVFQGQHLPLFLLHKLPLGKFNSWLL
jgi:hypothetical protein